jgi:hypothetical protein
MHTFIFRFKHVSRDCVRKTKENFKEKKAMRNPPMTSIFYYP